MNSFPSSSPFNDMVQRQYSASYLRDVRGLPAYVIADSELEMGASLGNTCCWVTLKGNGDIDSIFSTALGKKVLGSICVRYSGLGHTLLPGWQPAFSSSQGEQQERSRLSKQPASPELAFIPLRHAGPGMCTLHPAYQRHGYELPGQVQVEETIFVPHISPPGAFSGQKQREEVLVYQVIRLHNQAHQTKWLRVSGYVRLHGATPADIVGTYVPELGQGALLARNAGKPEWARIFGVCGEGIAVTGWETHYNATQLYEMYQVSPLQNDTSTTGAVFGALQLDLELAADAVQTFAFLTAFSHEGEAPARRIFTAAQDYEQALDETVEYYRQMLDVTEILTPDPQINLGVAWAKVNMLRVMASYPTGPAFTNDPGESSAVVGRDAAWFTYGCDYLLPSFGRHLLAAFAARQAPSGLLMESYNAVTGAQRDEGLNINDDTPLLLLAVSHYYCATRDATFLQGIYPAVRRAARYILSQRDTELQDLPAKRKWGLVTCTTQGTGSQGICSWRNIIQNYTLSGAVTEVNAECAAALRAAADLARQINTQEAQEDAHTFQEAASALTQAINTHLLNPETGFYDLTIDMNGHHRPDVTADELFPVLFGVAPPEIASRILNRLNSLDFWTPAGIRTVSQESPDYDPYRQKGLMGGIWPAVTWWYAYAAREHFPDLLAWAMRAGFEQYALDPRKNNTLPGQFSEWFDGESLVNRGMLLSPWNPPRFLWAAVEGLLGLRLTTHQIQVDPHVPGTWKWVGVHRLPLQGQEWTFFAARQQGQFQFFTTAEMAVPDGTVKHCYVEEISDLVRVSDLEICHLALKRPGEVLICLASTARRTILARAELLGALEKDRIYQVQLYSSEQQRWMEAQINAGRAFEHLALTLEAGGYRLLRFLA